MNLDGLPPELATPAWQAAYAALRFDNPVVEFRDENLTVSVSSIGNSRAMWTALFRRYWPCCDVYGNRDDVYSGGTLDDLARTIVAGLALHDDPSDPDNLCPNRDDHAHEVKP